MKKIALVFDGLEQGGIERIGVDYVRMCRELGYEVDVYNLAPKHYVTAQFLPKDIKVYNKTFLKYFCPELYSYGAQKWWWGKYAYAIVSPLLTLAQGIRKIVTRKRKYAVATSIAGHINDLSFVAKNFIKADRKICWCHGNILSYFAICDAYPFLYKKVDKFVVLSSAAQKDIYAGHKYMYDKEIIKIYNPTYFSLSSCNKEKVEEYSTKYGDFIWMVSRFEWRKAHEIAIEAVKRLKEKGVDKKIVFVGSGETLDGHKKFAEKIGIADNCIFTGYQSNVQDYIAASHVNLLTSRWEGLPTVIVEAMTIGKPCVMTNSDDGEVSGNGKYCKLVEIDDIDAIVDGLYELYTNPETYKKYQGLSLERAKAFAPDTVKSKLAKLLS